MGGLLGGGSNEAQMRADEQARQEEIRTGTASINDTFDSNFDDTYFSGLQQAYLDYAMPQIEDQRSEAAKQLTFALARGGNLESSSRASQASELQKLYDLQTQDAADQARTYANDSRTNVENARSNLISTLNVTGDATGAANAAINRAQVLSEPAAYDPVTDGFTKFTSGLGTAAAAERARAYGYGVPAAGGSATLYSSPKSAVAVRG